MQRYSNIITDQKVGGSSPSKRTETQEAFTTSWASSFLGLKAPAPKKYVKIIGWRKKTPRQKAEVFFYC
jgi:hypothetical protein